MSTKKTASGLGGYACIATIAASFALGGCGFTDLEMAAKQREIDKLTSDLTALKAEQVAACKAPAPVPAPAPVKAKVRSGPALSSR